jgi:cellulose synthase/poly-beta-1,6-N-acetylglucosamine synthase-like glycosyltransferase
MIFFIVIAVILVIYSSLLLYLWHAWKKVPVFKTTGGELTRISVIIPARDEEENIGRLLGALQHQDYSGQYEVIVVDDHSTDRTVERAGSYPFVRLVSLQESGTKKKAIATGIEQASGELIVTTDADCLPSPHWLATIASFYNEKKTVAIAAPVVVEADGSLVSIFQCLDFMMLQGITAATVHEGRLSMANGANLAYTKMAFDSVGGYQGVDHYASGDDMLLVYKMQRRFPGGYRYLLSRDAIVKTRPAPGLSAFLQQRQRWASKSFGYHDRRILPTLILVYLANLSILTSLVLAFLFPFFWFYFVLGLVIKTIAEWPLMNAVAGFFEQKRLMRFFPFMQPLHILYTIVIGMLSLRPRYHWKGRTLK